MDRTSNKMIADKLDKLIDILTANAMPSTSDEMPTRTQLETQPDDAPTEQTLNIDPQYVEHMETKVLAYALDKGEDAILYARKNVRGETKLAYCLASKWAGLKDKRILGAIKHIACTQ